MMKIQKPISRRGFLKIVAASSAIGLSLKLSADHLLHTEPVSVTRLLMGTIVNLKVISPEQRRASEAVDSCLEQMASLEAVLSRFDPNSHLSRLNQDGKLSQAHPALLELVTYANQVSSLTHGAFDISVKPLVDLYQSHQTSDQSLPSSEMVKQTQRLVDYRAIQINGSSIEFANPHMSITLDGIAKGFIVDEGVGVLKDFGFDNTVAFMNTPLVLKHSCLSIYRDIFDFYSNKKSRLIVHTYTKYIFELQQLILQQRVWLLPFVSKIPRLVCHLQPNAHPEPSARYSVQRP